MISVIRQLDRDFDAPTGTFRVERSEYIFASLSSNPAFRDIYLGDVLVSVEAFATQVTILNFLLFHVVNHRYLKKRPMIFTTNKPLRAWGKVLHDEDVAAAILDRVLEPGRFIHLDGPSGRTGHLNLEEALPGTADRARISGTHTRKISSLDTFICSRVHTALLTGFASKRRGLMTVKEAGVESSDLGRSLAVRLIERDRAALTTVDREIYLPDVLLSVETFKLQARLLNELHIYFPCVIGIGAEPGPPIPVSLGLENFASLPFPQLVIVRDTLPKLVDATTSFFNEQGTNWSRIEFFHDRDARRFFLDGLSEFLDVRFRARRSDTSTRPGVLFSVECSDGLRVYYSPSYWLQVQHVLNYPSSPARGWVQPGRFYFGAAPLGQAPRFDFSAYYDIPPQDHATLPF